MRRIESIDYLRGLMAVAVMIYHYASWALPHSFPEYEMSASHTLSRLGIYAVSMFYIISGLSLAIAYNGRLTSLSEAKRFAVKRVFRIFPLFWLVFTFGIGLGFAAALSKGNVYSFPLYEAVLNYTLLFGFIDPSAYITVGAWSIGNEMVFYAIFAVVMLGSVRWAALIPVAIAASVATGAWFAYGVLDGKTSLAGQWGIYINPFNQVVLFFLGVAIGQYAESIKALIARREAWWLIFAGGVAVFCFLPASGDQISLVTGHVRIILVATCALLVLATFVLDPVFRPVISKPLKFLGEASYSIYLMHPIVAWPITFIGGRLGVDMWISYCIAFVATLVAGWLTFTYLETPMMGAGKKLASRMKPQAPKELPATW